MHVCDILVHPYDDNRDIRIIIHQRRTCGSSDMSKCVLNLREMKSKFYGA